MRNIEIELVDASNRVDQDIQLVVRGLSALEKVDIKMVCKSFYCINAPMNFSTDVIWSARATFIANQSGKVDLSETPAIKGDYTGISKMGLFWNLKPEKKVKMQLEKQLENIPLHKDTVLEIEVYSAKKLLTKKSFKRWIQLPNIVHQDIHLELAQARLFHPLHQKDLPAIIILSGSDGRIEKAQYIAQLLANEGYATIAVAYFGLEGLPDNLTKIPLETVKEILEYLKKVDYIDSTRIGLYGRSKGAELALLSSIYFPEFKCLILNSPTDTVMEGIKNWKNSRESSWTLAGEEIPYRKFRIRDMILPKIWKSYSISVPSISRIPAEKLSIPTLLLGAKHDKIWNSYQSIQNILSHIENREIVYSYVYQHCGHMLTVAHQPNHRYKKVSKEDLMNDINDSWEKTLQFFKDFL